MTIEKAKHVLKEIKTLAQHASLTGSMRGGAPPLIKAYNEIFKLAVSNQWLENIGLVTEIDPEEAPDGKREPMGYVAGCAGLLMVLLEEK